MKNHKHQLTLSSQNSDLTHDHIKFKNMTSRPPKIKKFYSQVVHIQNSVLDSRTSEKHVGSFSLSTLQPDQNSALQKVFKKNHNKP